MLSTALMVIILDVLATFHVFPQRSLTSMVAGLLINTGSLLEIILSLWYVTCIAAKRVPLDARTLIMLMTAMLADFPKVRDFLNQ